MMVGNDKLGALWQDGPKNGLVEYLLENGIIAFGIFLSAMFFLIRECIKYRNDTVCKAGLIGLVASVLMLLSLYPFYNFYLWFPIALVIARLRMVRLDQQKKYDDARYRTKNIDPLTNINKIVNSHVSI